jgi:hypothetical protein
MPKPSSFVSVLFYVILPGSSIWEKRKDETPAETALPSARGKIALAEIGDVYYNKI